MLINTPPEQGVGGRYAMREPYRYRCKECGSTVLTPRTVLGGYRCETCGTIHLPEERIDMKAVA